MIVDAILELLLAPLTWLLGLFPSFTPPGSFSDTGGGVDFANSMHTFGANFAQLDSWVPVSLLVTCVGIVLASLVAAVALKGAIFIYEHIPGKAS